MIMKQEKIIIENGNVYIPDNIRMKPYEIAELFGVYTQMVNANIKTILKSDIVSIDASTGMAVCRNAIISDTYGLDMITAIAFHIQSHNAKIFRNWVIQKIVERKIENSIIIRLPGNVTAN